MLAFMCLVVASLPALPCRALAPQHAAGPATPAMPSPRAWVDEAAANQLRILDGEDREPLRYRVHKVDAKGDVVREVIESKEGNIARLIGRDGAPLSSTENQAERERLQGILDSPGDFLSHEQRDRASRRYAVELIHAMPGAMLWSYAPGQPAPAHGAQIALDFLPDPAFKPPTLVTEALTGIAGRLWIDTGSHCITRIEGRILHPVNFGWGGLLARISQGGTLAFEQQDTGGGRWLYARLSEHITVREMMVHNVRENSEMNVFDISRLSSLPTYGDAIRDLLALPVPTR